jgi:hypothetical protein
MANEEYKAGDRVKVYGVETVILRRMPEAEDYEVELTDEQQAQGLTPFVLPGRLELVERASDKAASKAAAKAAPEKSGAE